MTNEISMENKGSIKEKFFSTTGRIGRMTFFKRSVVLALIEVLLMTIVGFSAALWTFNSPDTDLITTAAMFIVGLLAIFPIYCLNVKRLHDLGKDETLAKIFAGLGIAGLAFNFSESTLAQAIIIISSIISLGFTIYLLFTRGEIKANQYGDAQ